jgi:predicted transcriptional regulator
MRKKAGFSKDELNVFVFLADEKGHGLWEMSEKLGIDKSHLSNVLKKLKTDGLIYRDERPLTRPPRERGPKTEYPCYIRKNDFSQIGQYLRDQVNFDRKSLEAAQIGKEGYHEVKQHGHMIIASGYLVDRPEKEIKKLETSLECLVKWSERRDLANPTWRDTDGVAQVDNTIKLAGDALESAKKKAKRILRPHPGTIIKVSPFKASK